MTNQPQRRRDLTHYMRPATALHNRVDTSVEAARSQTPRKLAINRRRIYAYIMQQGGATCDEAELATGIAHSTASAAIHAMHSRMDPPLLKDSAARRPTQTGCPAIVWVVT